MSAGSLARVTAGVNCGGACRHQRLVRRDSVALRTGHADDVLELREPRPDGRQVRQRLRVDHRDLRLGIGEPVFEGFGPEQERQRNGHGAHLVDRDVRDGRLAPLRQHERDLVAALHAQPRERVRHPVGFAVQVPERVRGSGARFVFPVQREARPIRGPAAAAGVRDIEMRRHLPSVRGMQRGVVVGGHAHSADVRRARLSGRYLPARIAGGSPPTVMAEVDGCSSRGSTVAQTQSGCCSINLP